MPCVIIGITLGIMSSFLGIGGGPINLVVLYYFFSMSTKVAAQNSLYIILISQITSVTTTLFTKTVPEFEWLWLVLMVAGGIGGGAVGRKINKKIDDKHVELSLIHIYLRRVFNTMAETLIHHTLSYCPRAAESQLAQVNPLAEINGMVFLDDIIAWSERLIDICHNLLRQTVDDSNMGPVLKYIEQNYMHNLTLSQISTVAGFSPNYFCNIFKACTGKSVSAYLTDLRIQQAKRLLTTTSKSINLIAEDVGYESSSYFIKIFKDTTGMTPNRFRRMNR